MKISSKQTCCSCFSVASASSSDHVILSFFLLQNVVSLCVSDAARCPVRVPSHLGQQASFQLLLLHGGYEANAHSHHLHRSAHLEHSAVHTAASGLCGQIEPSAGHATCESKVYFKPSPFRFCLCECWLVCMTAHCVFVCVCVVHVLL